MRPNPKTYFDLINIIGSKGNYQTVVFFIFALNWFVAGILLLGTSFIFMEPEYDCEGTDLEIQYCEQQICSQQEQLWGSYLKKPQVESLATQFGPYVCEKKNELNGLRMILYVGTFVGYLIFLFITDNFGRKVSVVAAWGVTTFGVFILCISQNMTTACIGLFLAGAGCESSIRISMAIFGEIVDYYKRQSYSVALQIAFGFSGVVVGCVYWIFRAWRIVTIIFCFIPCVIQLLLLIFYVQQTPKFLLTKKGIEKSLKSLNRIAKINQNSVQNSLNQQRENSQTQNHNQVTRQDIESVLNAEECGDKFDFIITPLHLFTFQSLRKNTICCSLIFMLITYLYFGPMVIIDKLGINPFVSQIFVSLSELIAYPFAFWFIQKLPRIKSGYICFALAIVFNGILIFVKPGEQCDGCVKGIIEIIFVFLSRFVISFYFAIFFLYVTEIFPLRARGLGFGIASACGAIASSSGQIIFTTLEDNFINPMIFFCIFSILAIIVLCFMGQTLNCPLQDEIKEIQLLKNQEKQNAQHSKEEESPKYEMQQVQKDKKEGFSNINKFEE